MEREERERDEWRLQLEGRFRGGRPNSQSHQAFFYTPHTNMPIIMKSLLARSNDLSKITPRATSKKFRNADTRTPRLITQPLTKRGSDKHLSTLSHRGDTIRPRIFRSSTQNGFRPASLTHHHTGSSYLATASAANFRSISNAPAIPSRI